MSEHMSAYHCRSTSPLRTPWTDVEAKSPEHAAGDYHASRSNDRSFSLRLTREQDGGFETVLFASIEVDGHGQYVSRLFHRGINRRGGVRSARTLTISEQLATIARELGWTKAPEELLADGWDGEEMKWT